MFTHTVDEEITLALIAPQYVPQLFTLVQNNVGYLAQFLAWPVHTKTEQDMHNFVQHSLQQYAKGEAMVCVVLYKGSVAGTVSFNSINTSLGVATLGYWLGKNYTGKGIMSRCVQKMMQLAFTEFDMQKVQTAAATQNTASRAIPERLGFTQEGTITRAENINGRVLDHAVYAMSKTDWLQE